MEPENQKVFISRDVTFIEDEMTYLDKAEKIVRSDIQSSSGEVQLDHRSDSNKELDPINVPDDEIQIQEGTEMVDDSELDDLSDYQLARDRQRRKDIKKPARYSNNSLVYYAFSAAEEVESSEPGTYREAVKSRERDRWIKAMQDEIDSLLKNGTWILVTKSILQKVIGCKWIFKRKVEASENDRIRYKARLVAKGYNQREGIDYNEIFSPVVKHSSIRILMFLVAQNDLELHQLV